MISLILLAFSCLINVSFSSPANGHLDLHTPNNSDFRAIETESYYPYVRLIADTYDPLPWAGQAVGLYQLIPNELINENPVYKHEHLDLYLMVTLYENYYLGVTDDVYADSYYFMASGIDVYNGYLTGPCHVWNGDAEELQLTNFTWTLEWLDYPNLDPINGDIDPPCQVELTSNGPFKTRYAEQMGVYSLIENDLCHGRPVWTKQNHFLIMDDGGSWVLSERHLCQFRGGNSIYFGSVDNLYLNTPLPTIGEHRWAHVGDDENDLIKDDVYVEDGTMLVEDVCGWTDNTISTTGKFKMSQNTAWSWAAGSTFISGIFATLDCENACLRRQECTGFTFYSLTSTCNLRVSEDEQLYPGYEGTFSGEINFERNPSSGDNQAESGGGSNSEVEVLDWNFYYNSSHLPTYAEPRENCREVYCGANAMCVEDDLCECKTGYSGDPYFWGGCVADPCAEDPCGDFAICEPGQGTDYQCVCPEGDYYMKDPEDDKACVVNPCGNLVDASSGCVPNLETDQCDCPRDPFKPLPAGADPEDGFYGEWGEWSECPILCRLDEDDLPMRQTRKRVCYGALNNDAMGCESKGPAEEERICGDAICPSVPEWSLWGPWESCSAACSDDGEGIQTRRRICLDDMRSELSCANSNPEGPSVQEQKCRVDISCGGGTSFSSWSDWGQCDLPCNPRDGESLGVQFRNRECSGFGCGSLDESVTKQFRVCPDLELCSESKCHNDWWKESDDGPFHFGCADTDESGVFWCPLPGGVDENSIADSQAKHTCSPSEIEVARSRRASTPIKNQCPSTIFIRCNQNIPSYDKAYCNAIKMMYGEKQGQKSLRKEDIGFVESLRPLAGWDPLTQDEKAYKNPLIKYEFYQDILNQLDKYAPECETKHIVQVWQSLKRSTDTSKQCALDQDCGAVSKGKNIFSNIVQNAINKLNRFSRELDEITRDYAKAKVATGAVGTAAGAVGTAVAVVGACFAPLTGGFSLVATAAGAAAAGAGVATAIASFTTFLTERKVTNRKMRQLKWEHERAARCVKRMSKLSIAVTDSYNEVGKYLKTDEFAAVMLALSDQENVDLKDDVDFIVQSYTQAFLHIPTDEAKELLAKATKTLNDLDKKKEAAPPTDRAITRGVKGPLQQAIDCGMTPGGDIAGQFVEKGRQKAICLISSGMLSNLLSIVGLANSTVAAEGILWTQQSISNYGKAKAFKNAPQGVLDTIDIAVLENKLAFDITKDPIRGQPGFVGTNAANQAILNDVANRQETRNYRRLRRMRKLFEGAVNSRAWKLFTKLSDWKKSFKAKTLKALRKGLTSKKFRQGVATKWKATGLGSKWKTLKTKFRGKFIKGLDKIGIKFTGKSVGKFLSKVSFGLLDVGLGIWDIVDGVKAIKEGNAQAKAFRKAGRQINGAKNDLGEVLNVIKKRCDSTSRKIKCELTEWSRWGDCKNLDSHPKHYKEKGWICGDMVSERKRTFKVFDGEAQDAYECGLGNSCGTMLEQRKPCATDNDGADAICGPGWMRLTSPRTCIPNGFYRKTEKKKFDELFPVPEDVYEYEQVVSQETINTWKWKKDEEEDQLTVYYNPQGDKGPAWFVGWLISKSETEKYLKWYLEAVTADTCPVGPDIPWVGSAVDGAPKVRNKDFQLVCLGPKDSCCKK